MSEEDVPGKPSGSLLGKEFILVLVIVFSGLSFTLGYFVGRNAGSVTTAESIEPQNRGYQSVPPPDQVPVQSTEQAQARAQAAQPDLGASAAPVAAAMPDNNTGRETPLTPPEQRGTVAEQKGSGAATASSGTESRAEETSKRYTVQIGAFKNSAEAKQMKTTFEKKGYKPYISPARDKKGQKIYQVKTGEFRDRKEAEVLALRLKKTEGLHTYVTTASE